MYQVDDNQETATETLHLYVVREPLQKPSWLPVALSLFALSVIVTLFAVTPSRQPVVRAVIRVPAVFLPLQVYSATAQIQATGIKTYPAMPAHGTLTITNGSAVASTLPVGMIFTANDGTEVATQSSVYVPAGSALGYGYASVQARAVQAGKRGNIAALAINAVYGTSLYIRNLQAFTGGKDAYSVKVVTPQDRQNALNTARAFLGELSYRYDNLVSPCKEAAKPQDSRLTLTWTCRYIHFTIPAYMHIVAWQLVGKYVVVQTWYKPHPTIIVYK